MSLESRRARREQERKASRTRRSSGSGSGAPGNPFVRPLIVAVVGLALILGLRAAGVFEPGAPKVDAADARFDPAGQKVGDRQVDEGRGHVVTGQKVTYKGNPPTSGDHWDTPAPWGSYDRAQPDERTVHNLEHGGIVISYSPNLAAEEQQKLTALVSQLRSQPYRKILLQPYPNLADAKIALAAWDWLLKLPAFDETLIVRFVRAHYDGPEAPEPGVP